MGYKWKEVQKGVFIDGHEREDVVEHRETFLEEMRLLLPYLVEFSEDDSILEKDYLDDCAVGGPDRRPIIMITHDESTFSANDGRQEVWTFNEQGVLRPKGKGKGTMVSDFLLPWSRLNFFSSPPKQQEALASFGVPTEVVTYFEYGKTGEGYWMGKYLLDQIIKKAFAYWGSLVPRVRTFFFV